MAYTATVIEIMIASPSDVSNERGVVRDVINEWNAVNAKDRRIVLFPLGWETHASPDMGDRPQEIINRQLLSNADILVAIFWTRLGSPTGAAPSGTVEEIEKHLDAGKQAMLYFSSALVPPGSTDNDQYAALRAFKESCKQKGLVEEYETVQQFKDKFSRQLAQKVIEYFSGLSLGPDEGGPTLAPEKAFSLSEAARKLLLEAKKDPHGIIYRISDQVMTNGRKFGESGEPRAIARWKNAVDELNDLALIEDTAGREEVFRITDEGYRVADSLDQQESSV